jgi:hypothetical protein
MGPRSRGLWGSAGGSAGHRALRYGVTRKPNCKGGRDGKALDHWNCPLLSAPSGTFLEPA